MQPLAELFYAVVIYSTLAASLFLILTKYRVIEYAQLHTKSLLNKLFNCTFCICFWLNLFICLIGLTFGAGYITLLAPFASASLTRAIIG